ncbi:MAG: aspartyl protease family protein [Bacteroidota bacterium]
MMAIVLIFALLVTPSWAAPSSGFNFAEGVSHTTLPFVLYKNLMIIPARLNDSVTLRLILDTGTRSALLYGKRFANLATLMRDKKIKVTGWGGSSGTDAMMAYPNQLDIADVSGQQLSIAVVPNRRLLAERPDIDGVIGYELFVRFVVEINYQTQTIHLYNRLHPVSENLYTSIPLEINQARPQVLSTIRLKNKKEITLKLLVDTGSSLGLTVYARDREGFPTSFERDAIGIGLAGWVYGFDLFVDYLHLNDFLISGIRSHLIHVEGHPDENFHMAGSLGAGFLKDHIVIFDYPGSRMLLRRNTTAG